MIVAAGKPEHPCRGCPLGLLGEGFVRGDGPLADILVVGEAPGATEVLKGRPFVGQAGWMLDRLLGLAEIPRSRVRVANVLCCRPPKNYLAGAPYEYGAIAACRDLLLDEIHATKPRVIIAMGNIAMRALTGWSGIARLRGFPARFEGIPVIPTFHPSFLLPRPEQHDTARMMGAVVLDLKKAVEIAEHGIASVEERYTLDPTPAEAMLWAVGFEAGDAAYLSVDIETAGGRIASELDEDDDADLNRPEAMQITRVGFSSAPGVAMSIPMGPGYRDVIRRVLAQTAVPTIVWNGYAFDVPILRSQGFAVGGVIIDAMWAWHHLQSNLPRGLESVASHFAWSIGPWKHLSASQPARYNAIDADVAGRCYAGVRALLERQGRWETFMRHVVELFPFLYHAGRENGVEIAREPREALRQTLAHERSRVLRAVQIVVPARLKAKKSWTRIPKELAGEPFVDAVEERLVNVCSLCGKERITTKHFARCPMGYPVEQRRAAPVKRWAPDWVTVDEKLLDKAVLAAGFNPLSQQQMVAYAKDAGHAVGENWKTGKDAFDRRVRARLIRRHGADHPLYGLSQRLQDVNKTLSTYVDGFEPNARGRVHTTYTFAPSTGRLSSRNVNLQNIGHHSSNPYAVQVRRMIRPPFGFVYVEADSSAIEAVMTGYFMEDADYVELAKRGVHDFLTCLEQALPFDLRQLDAYKGDPAYAAARERNKRVVHGTNYGMTPKMMRMQFPEFFETESAAADAQARYLAACPRLAPWQHGLRVLAHRQKFLENPWGYRHYFYDVFSKNAAGEVVPGGDAKRVVAFLPQSSAAAFMRDSLLIVKNSPYAADAPGNVSVHDSICLCAEEAHVDEAVQWLAAVMTRPISCMGDLRIGCEVKVGENWLDMRTVHRETTLV